VVCQYHDSRVQGRVPMPFARSYSGLLLYQIHALFKLRLTGADCICS
jgi:hypothetical protein